MKGKRNKITQQVTLYNDINELGVALSDSKVAEDLTASEVEMEMQKRTTEELKNAKKEKAYQLYTNYTLKPVIWSFTWLNKSYSFKIDGVVNANLGVSQAKTRLERQNYIQNLINNGGFADIPLQYRNIEYGYKSIYIDIFNDFNVDRVVFKVINNSNANTLLQLYTEYQETISSTYDATNLDEFQRFLIDYYAKREELFALTSIQEVKNFDISVEPIQLNIPENLIENVIFCNI